MQRESSPRRARPVSELGGFIGSALRQKRSRDGLQPVAPGDTPGLVWGRGQPDATGLRRVPPSGLRPNPDCYTNLDCPNGYRCQEGMCVLGFSATGGLDIGFAPPSPRWPASPASLKAAVGKAVLELVGSRWYATCAELFDEFSLLQAQLKSLWVASLAEQCAKDAWHPSLFDFWANLAACLGTSPPTGQGEAIALLCAAVDCPTCDDPGTETAVCAIKQAIAIKNGQSTGAWQCGTAPAPPIVTKWSNACAAMGSTENTWNQTSEAKGPVSKVIGALGISSFGDALAPLGSPARVLWEFRTVLALAALKGCDWFNNVVLSKSYQPLTFGDMTAQVNIGASSFEASMPCYWGAIELVSQLDDSSAAAVEALVALTGCNDQ